MRKHKVVSVVGLPYQVIEVDEIQCYPSIHGLCNFSAHPIHLKRGLSPEARRTTLLHEALHAIAHELQVKELHDPETKVQSSSAVFQLSAGLGVAWADLCEAAPLATWIRTIVRRRFWSAINKYVCTQPRSYRRGNHLRLDLGPSLANSRRREPRSAST